MLLPSNEWYQGSGRLKSRVLVWADASHLDKVWVSLNFCIAFQAFTCNLFWRNPQYALLVELTMLDFVNCTNAREHNLGRKIHFLTICSLNWRVETETIPPFVIARFETAELQWRMIVTVGPPTIEVAVTATCAQKAIHWQQLQCCNGSTWEPKKTFEIDCWLREMRS